MNWSLIFLLSFLQFSSGFITWIEKRFPLPGIPSSPGSPWPLPRSWTKSPSIVGVDPLGLKMESNVKKCDVIDEAIERYKKKKIFLDVDLHSTSTSTSTDYSSLPLLRRLLLISTDERCHRFLSLNSSEKYSLQVKIQNEGDEKGDEKGNEGDVDARIEAQTIWGILRGLETFSQLVWQTDHNSYVMNVTSIEDYPRYKHRGILLDSSRHFQPMSILLKNLEAMESNKFNVFHWHIVDDQSFPYESKTFPNLTTKGAYSPSHVYSQSDVAKMIEEARLRGIRVIVEFDTPGHTMGFAKAFPQLLTPCYGDGKTAGTANYSVPHADYEILDPSNNFTFWFMDRFFEEIRQVFPDEYIHLGMDEVYYGCWKSSPKIKEFMKRNGLSEYNQVQEFYVRWMIEMIKEKGFKYITWQDPVDNGIVMATDTIIHVWKDQSLDKNLGFWQDYIAQIAKKKYQIILSSCWYLNYISYGQDWKKYYECDPKNFTGTDEEKELVIGGEVCLWGEYVDGTNLLSRLWPRASAVAERLWSSESVRDTGNASYRLDEHRCRMLRRGIPAQPILNGFCGSYEWQYERYTTGSNAAQPIYNIHNNNNNILNGGRRFIDFLLFSVILKIIFID